MKKIKKKVRPVAAGTREKPRRIGANGEPALGRRKEKPCTWEEARAAVRVIDAHLGQLLDEETVFLPTALDAVAVKAFMGRKKETAALAVVRNALWQLHDKGYIGKKVKDE